MSLRQLGRSEDVRHETALQSVIAYIRYRPFAWNLEWKTVA